MGIRCSAARARAGMFAALIVVLLVTPIVSAAAPPQGSVGRVTPIGTMASLLQSDAEGIVLRVEAPNYTVTTGSAAGIACETVEAPGYVLSEEAGRPQLPYEVVLLGVPPGADVQVTAETSATTLIAPGLPPCAAPKAVAQYDDEGNVQDVVEEPARDAAIYNTDRLYPAEVARVVDLGFMRSQRVVRLEVTPVQVNPVTGERLFHKDIRVTLRFGADGSGASAAESAATAPAAEPAAFEGAFSSLLLNYDSARAWRGSTSVAAAASSAAWTPPTPAYKVTVKEAGLYELSYDALSAAGLPVGPAGLDAATLRLFADGQEVAIRVLDGGDGRLNPGDSVLFYGQGVNTRYTDTRYYWLTYGAVAGKRMAERASVSGGAQSTAFRSVVRDERNLAYISSLPMLPGFDHWYGSPIQVSGAGVIRGLDFKVSLADPAPGAAPASLTVNLAGNSTGQHHVRALVNGNQVLDRTWFGRTMLKAAADFPQSYLVQGDNTVRLELVNDAPGQTFDLIRVDWFEIGYGRAYIASGDRLEFGSGGGGAAPQGNYHLFLPAIFVNAQPATSGPTSYQIAGFTGSEVEVYDIADLTAVTRITGGTVTPASGSYTLGFGDNPTSARRYLALTPAQRLTPAAITADTASSLQSASNGADYIVITHRDFWDAVQPLVDRRQAQGMRVVKVDVQDIYDEFNYGQMSAEAIHDFLAYAYQNWTKPAPADVLLVGDGNYDMRLYLASSAKTYLPPYLELVDPDIGETVADNRFVTLTPGDILPDMNVGRLPANTAAEAAVMVNKTIGYETAASAQAWQRNALFVADDAEGGGGNFYEYSDKIADGYADPPANTKKLLPADFTRTKAYLGQTCTKATPAEECRTKVVDAINAGTLLVSYIGHGTKTQWATEQIMNLAALDRLTNSAKLTIMLPMTCDNGYFAEPKTTDRSFSEAIVRMAAGGAVASWSPTGFGLASGHDYLEQGLFLALFHQNVSRLGPATTQSKLYLVATAPPGAYRDLIDTYVLIGDPALTVPVN